MVETKVFTKQEYVELIPPVSKADFERLKKSIKETNGLLNPIILNQDNVVLDGHHRMRACKELGIKVIYNTKDFEDQPLEELRYVVAVNLHRRHLDEFQKAQIGLKMEKIAREIAAKRRNFDTERATAAAKKRWQPKESFDAATTTEMPNASRDAQGITSDNDLMTKQPGHEEEEEEEEEELQKDYEKEEEEEDPNDDYGTKKDDAGVEDERKNYVTPLRSSKEIGDEVGVSASTIDRVKTILEQGSPDQIQALKQKSETGEGPGVRTTYEQIQQEKLKKKLQNGQGDGHSKMEASIKEDQVRLLNKDFRTTTMQEIPDGSVDLVLVLDTPESSRPEDQPGRIHEQLLESSANWLKDGGMLVMSCQQQYWARTICVRPPMMKFYHCIALLANHTPYYDSLQSKHTIFETDWMPLLVYVKGLGETQPLSPQIGTADRIGGGSEVWSEGKEFAKDLIKRLSPADSTIVDPFMGKGTVGQACIELGRKYVGIERESTQFLTAMNMLHEIDGS